MKLHPAVKSPEHEHEIQCIREAMRLWIKALSFWEVSLHFRFPLSFGSLSLESLVYTLLTYKFSLLFPSEQRQSMKISRRHSSAIVLRCLPILEFVRLSFPSTFMQCFCVTTDLTSRFNFLNNMCDSASLISKEFNMHFRLHWRDVKNRELRHIHESEMKRGRQQGKERTISSGSDEKNQESVLLFSREKLFVVNGIKNLKVGERITGFSEDLNREI